MSRVRVGVIGCGLIAQLMHLAYLEELEERFEIAAVCDASPGRLAKCAGRFGVRRCFQEWRELLAEPLDAVLVVSSGSHAEIACAAAEAGLHLFVEKPMAMALGDARAMQAAADRAGVLLMVGNTGRYDPAYERLQRLVDETKDIRFVRVTTSEAPLPPTTAHQPLWLETDDIPAATRDAFAAEEAAALERAVGDCPELAAWCYRWILVESLVHEISALRGLFGEPTAVHTVDLSRECVNVGLRFGELRCQLTWLDLPGISSYRQEFTVFAPDRRLSLIFPSPYLKSLPSELTVETGEVGGQRVVRSTEVVSYDEAFKRELVEFSEAIAARRRPRTAGVDGIADLVVCRAIVDAFTTGGPVALAASPPDSPASRRPAWQGRAAAG